MLSKKLQAACNAPVVVDDGSISFVGSAKYEFTHTGSGSYNYDDVTISFASSAVAAAQAGDLAIIYICNDDNNDNTGTTPSGWYRYSLSDYGAQNQAYVKTLTSSDVSFSVTWSDSSSNDRINPAAIMMVFRNAGIKSEGGVRYHSQYSEARIPGIASLDADDAMVTFVGAEIASRTPSWPTTNYSDSAVSAVSGTFLRADAGYDLDPGSSFSEHTIYTAGLRGITFILNKQNPEAQGAAVSSTDLPSTVVCYTHGVGDRNDADTIDGWYRTSDGQLWKSDELFKSEGSTYYTGQFARGTTYYGGYRYYGIFDRNEFRRVIETPGEWWDNSPYETRDDTSSVYDGDHPLYYEGNTSTYYIYYTGRWVNTWMRDYLPAQVQAGANSLCIEFWMFNYGYDSYYYTNNVWWMHYGGFFNGGHGFDMWNRDHASSATNICPGIYHGPGYSNSVHANTGTTGDNPVSTWAMTPYGYASDNYDSDYGAEWFHWSFLWDFQNGRVAIHRNGVEIAAETNTSRYTASNFEPAPSSDTNLSNEYGAMVFGCPAGVASSYGRAKASVCEFIVSIDDTTKQARWGNSFTPANTPLIEGGGT